MLGKNRKMTLEEADWKRQEEEARKERKEREKKIKAVRKEKGKVKY